jgi:hypothetical protein
MIVIGIASISRIKWRYYLGISEKIEWAGWSNPTDEFSFS